MKRICPYFRKKINYLNLEIIEASNDSTYILDTDFKMRAYNSAYVRFGHENDCPEVEERFGIGFDLRDAIYGPPKNYYERKFREVIEKSTPLSFDYECSSPDKYRLLRQTAYPIRNKQGLLLSNHMTICHSHTNPSSKLTSNHKTTDNMVIQCCHCRKVKNLNAENQWDWIPELVEKPYAMTSHTLCHNCLTHYYPDF